MRVPVVFKFRTGVEIILIIFVLIWATPTVNCRSVQPVALDSQPSSCGYFRKSRVMGGDASDSGEFPWITSIQTAKGKHFCAGFLINERFLISASHCFVKRFNSDISYDVNGAVDLNSMKVALNLVTLSHPSNVSKEMKVKKLTLHPAFDTSSLNNDIAILELKDAMKLDQTMYPICLPKVQNEIDGTGNVTVAGWGYRQCTSINPSNELHKITVPLWDSEECKKKYTDSDYDFTREDYVCAGSDGKDISKGDSGGPLQILLNNRWTAIGIVSSGKFMCSDKVPGVYTRVSSYLEWIEKEAHFKHVD